MSTSHKYFTVQEANRTLPLVRKIVNDIIEEYRVWKEHVFRYELVAAGSSAEQGESEEQIGLRKSVDASARRIDNYVEELSSIGCLFKGFEEGLVDFYATHEGRDILLCWKHGEDAVKHWHEVDAGFSGRQPLVAGETGSGKRETY